MTEVADCGPCHVNYGWNIPAPSAIHLREPYAGTGVMSRGNRQQDTYLDDVDRQDFLKTLATGSGSGGRPG
jgi:hypothetical protein